MTMSNLIVKGKIWGSKVHPVLWWVLVIVGILYLMIYMGNPSEYVSQSPNVFVDNTPTPPTRDMPSVDKVVHEDGPFGHTLEEAKVNAYFPAHSISAETRHVLRNVKPMTA